VSVSGSRVGLVDSKYRRRSERSCRSLCHRSRVRSDRNSRSCSSVSGCGSAGGGLLSVLSVESDGSLGCDGMSGWESSMSGRLLLGIDSRLVLSMDSSVVVAESVGCWADVLDCCRRDRVLEGRY
jgi:hypothetical protein